MLQIQRTVLPGSESSKPRPIAKVAFAVAHTHDGMPENRTLGLVEGAGAVFWDFDPTSAIKRKKSKHKDATKGTDDEDTEMGDKDPGRAYYQAKVDADKTAFNAYLANRTGDKTAEFVLKSPLGLLEGALTARWDFDLGEIMTKAAKKKKMKQQSKTQEFIKLFIKDAAKEEALAKRAYDQAAQSGVEDPGKAYHQTKISADGKAMVAYLASPLGNKTADLVAKRTKKQQKKHKKAMKRAYKMFGKKKVKKLQSSWEKKNQQQLEEVAAFKASKAPSAKEPIATDKWTKKITESQGQFWHQAYFKAKEEEAEDARKHKDGVDTASLSETAPSAAAEAFSAAAIAANVDVKKLLDSLPKPSCQEPCPHPVPNWGHMVGK